MNSQKINLSKFCINKEIHYILTNSKMHEVKIVLQNPYYQQQVVEYVLSQINHRYFELCDFTEIPKQAKDILPHCPIEERIIIRQYIQLGTIKIIKTLLKDIKPKQKQRIEV